MSIRNSVRSLVVLWIGVVILVSASRTEAVKTVRIASNLERPVCLVAPPGDNSRLFVVEQWMGFIRVIREGEVLPQPFLVLSRQINIHGEERGLLGLAFHPEYERNGLFFVNYTRSGDGATVVSRFHVSSDPDRAESASEAVLLTIPQPYSNHNGGGIVFGPDGYLYLGMGDGGSANDPENRAQDDQELLGKLLRISVNGSPGYSLPESNPFTSSSARGEIWAKGLRNPWRFTFDRETGDLYIADVGQDRWEEIDFQPAGSKGGENYGWRCLEADHCTGFSGCRCNHPSLVRPIYEYSHDSGCSVTGGYVYRGCALPELKGIYFFADYCSNRIWSFRYRSGGITDFREFTRELAPGDGLNIRGISSFGQDNDGELYMLDLLGGEVFKIVPDRLDDCNRNFISDRCEIAAGTCFDNNHNGIPDECEKMGAAHVSSAGSVAQLGDNFDPFSSHQVISFDLPRNGMVDVAVYHIREQRAISLVHNSMSAGHHTVTFDAAGQPAGLYICQLKANGHTVREKLLQLK